MLKFGQPVKLTKTIKYRMSKHYRKTWEKAFKIEKYVNPRYTYHASNTSEYWINMIVPEGTIGVLYKVYIDLNYEHCWIKIRNPKTKKASHFRIGVPTSHITTDLDPVERASVADLQRELAIKTNGDNFDKIRKLKRMLEAD